MNVEDRPRNLSRNDEIQREHSSALHFCHPSGSLSSVELSVCLGYIGAPFNFGCRYFLEQGIRDTEVGETGTLVGVVEVSDLSYSWPSGNRGASAF